MNYFLRGLVKILFSIFLFIISVLYFLTTGLFFLIFLFCCNAGGMPIKEIDKMIDKYLWIERFL